MDSNMWLYYAADSPSKHNQVSTYHSLTGNEWLDAFIIALMLIIPPLVMIWLIETRSYNRYNNLIKKTMTDKTKTEQIHQYYISRLERLAFEESSEYKMSTNHLEVELKNIHKFFHTLLDLTEKDVKEDYCILASKKKDIFTQSLIPSS